MNAGVLDLVAGSAASGKNAIRFGQILMVHHKVRVWSSQEMAT